MKTLEKVNYKRFIIPLLVGLIFWFTTPIRPAGLSATAWQMLAIFLATIIGCITKPLPIAGVALIGFSLTVLLRVVPMDNALLAFSSDAVWLIAMAFFLSRGFIKTGLGRRIVLFFVKTFGKSTLGLAYSLIGVDLILSPAMPSNTARTGGVMYPIIKSISEILGSTPEKHSEKKLGSFLVFAAFHGDVIISALFATAMAPNLIVMEMAQQQHIHITWLSWFLASCVPSILALIVIPLILYKIYPPEIKKIPNAKTWADDELKKLGKWTLPEKVMLTVFICALILWMLSSLIQIDAALVAFLAVSVMLITGVLTTKDMLQESGAWNTLLWFSILIFMANSLNTLGFIPWFSKKVSSSLKGISWVVVLIAIMVIYFYSHYLFASGTAHVSAMYGALLAVAISSGVPSMLAAMQLAFIGSLFSSTTHYASGSASVMFESGYVTQKEWWQYNFIIGIIDLLIYGIVGSLWMKVIGMW